MLSDAIARLRKGSSGLSGAAPKPEGPAAVGERVEALNRPKPWNLPAQAGRLLGKLDLRVGATVVVLAEILNAAAGEHVAGLASLPYPGGVLAFVLPVLAGFFHRKGKSKASDGSFTEPTRASTPQEVAAAVSESRKSPWRKLYHRVKRNLDEF